MPMKITLIGLGSMGTQLARALIRAGHDLTVWNRSAARGDAFKPICTVAEDVETACKDSDLILSCLASYDATYMALDRETVRAVLKGKTLVQMSTATPEEARVMGGWAAAHGINYLEAKIAVTPAQIGEAMTVIFYAGPEILFKRYEPILACLGGRPTYLGEALDRAVMGDFAFLSVYFAGIIGVLHGAAFCAATGLDTEQFFGLIPSFFHEINARGASFQAMIAKRAYDDVQSALQTDLAGAELLAATAIGAGLEPLFSQSLVTLLARAAENGRARYDTAAMLEYFLGPPRR